MKTFLRLLILVPLAAIAVAFAVANRQVTTVSFDPFATDVPAFALTGPLFIVLLVTVVAGVIIGGIATWIGQGRHRQGRRTLRRENDTLRSDNDRMRAELAQNRAVAAADPVSRVPALPPV